MDDLRARLKDLMSDDQWRSKQYLEETLHCDPHELDEAAKGLKLERGYKSRTVLTQVA